MILLPHLSIPCLFELSVPMHCSRGKVDRPLLPGSRVGCGQRCASVASPKKGRASVGLPATPAVSCAGALHPLPCLAAAATASAAPAVLAVPPHNADDGEDHAGESQPLLSPSTHAPS